MSKARFPAEPSHEHGWRAPLCGTAADHRPEADDEPAVEVRRGKQAAGEALAEQASHRPDTAPALGLRAGRDVSPLSSRPQRRERMKRYRLAASLALAILGVLALAGSVAAGEQVPFK